MDHISDWTRVSLKSLHWIHFDTIYVFYFFLLTYYILDTRGSSGHLYSASLQIALVGR